MAESGIETEEISRIIEQHTQEKTGKRTTGEVAEDRILLLTDTDLKHIYEQAAVIGAREAMKKYDNERKREHGKRTDKRLRNTKLLLRNYRMLKKHAENSVFSRMQMEESAFDILESMMSNHDNEVIINSIKESAARTAVMVSHIDTMLSLYAVFCEKSPNHDIEQRRYDVLWDMYMAEDTLSAKEIAEKQNMSKENVYKDIRVAIERLSALIFGVDGLNVQ